MYCRECGQQINDDADFCPFCGHKTNKQEEHKVYHLADDNIQRNANGYVDLKTNIFHHLIIAGAAYLTMYLLIMVVSSIMINIYKGQGIDFTCITKYPDNYFTSCPIEVTKPFILTNSLSQVIGELVVIGIIALIFRKHLKNFFKSATNKSTWVNVGIALAIIYGGTYVYAFILQLFKLDNSSTNQNAVNELIFTFPLLGFLFVGIAAPLFEEIIFRFGIFRAFTHGSKKMEIAGLIITTALFALVHVIPTFQVAFKDMNNIDYALLKSDLLTLPIYLIGAFALTFSYYKSKNLFTSMATHMIYNSISFFLIILTSQVVEGPAQALINLFHLIG